LVLDGIDTGIFKQPAVLHAFNAAYDAENHQDMAKQLHLFANYFNQLATGKFQCV